MADCNKEHAAPGYIDFVFVKGSEWLRVIALIRAITMRFTTFQNEFYMRFQTPMNFKDFQTSDSRLCYRKLYITEIRLV
jgi:hypothetical protein